jgi:hypothetical protein
MEKPKVQFIENQRVESTREVTGYEAEEILRKYGVPQQGTTRPQELPPAQPELTFEEMVARQEAQDRDEKLRKQHKLNGPKPITFQGKQYDTEIKYGSDDESGFGFKIEITTDMKLPRY